MTMVDASIPLSGVMPKLLTPLEAQMQVSSLRDLQAQTQLNQQKAQAGQASMADQQKLATVPIDPETGAPSIQGMISAGVSPQTIQQINSASLESKGKKIINDMHKSTTASNNMKVKEDAKQKVLEDSMAEYSAASAKGPEAAQAAAQKVFMTGIDTLKTSGLFSKDEANAMPTEFNPQAAQARLLGLKQMNDMEDRQKDNERADKALSETIRHNKVGESNDASTNARLELAAGGGAEPAQAEKDIAVATWIQNPASLRGMDKTIQRNIVKWAADKGIKPEDIIAGRAQAKFDLSSAVTAGHRAGSMATVEAAMPDLIANARQTSANVPRGKFVPFTKLMQTADESISDPNLLSMKIANQALASEYQTVIARGGSNVTSLKEAMHLLQTAPSQDAYEAALKQVEKEVQINVNASHKVRSDLGAGSKAAPAASAAISYPTATNPQTGEKVIFKDGKWQPTK